MKRLEFGDESLLHGYRTSARALLITILRSVALERDSPIWTATLVQALGFYDMEERNARQAIMRIGERGMLRAEKVGAKTRWHITDRGGSQLAIAQKRAVDFGGAQHDWDGHWLVVFCPISEEQREKRRLFRSHLEFHGFSFVSGGIAVSTHVEREPHLTSILKDFDLDRGALVFKATTGEVLNDSDLLQRAWDLDALAGEYTDFIAQFEQKTAARDDEKFTAFIALQHAWFHFAFIDPELPRTLLPNPWIGDRAKALVDKKNEEWRDDACHWFDRIDGLVA